MINQKYVLEQDQAMDPAFFEPFDVMHYVWLGHSKTESGNSDWINIYTKSLEAFTSRFYLDSMRAGTWSSPINNILNNSINHFFRFIENSS